MASQKTPAYLRKENGSHHHSKADLDKMIYLEEKLRGENDLVEDAPETLTELGQAYYYFIIEQFANNKLLSNLDIPLLTQAADCLEKMDLCDTVLNEDGLFIQGTDSKGNTFTKEHPAVKTKMQYLNQFRYVAGQLGMSPSARAQMAEAKMETKQEEQSPLNQLLNKKKNN